MTTILVAVLPSQAELEEQLAVFEKEGILLEAQRLKQRTEYDIEMLRERWAIQMGLKISLDMDGRSEGEPFHIRFSTFSQMIFIMIDESHMTMGHK